MHVCTRGKGGGMSGRQLTSASYLFALSPWTEETMHIGQVISIETHPIHASRSDRWSFLIIPRIRAAQANCPLPHLLTLVSPSLFIELLDAFDIDRNMDSSPSNGDRQTTDSSILLVKSNCKQAVFASISRNNNYPN
jgi:hypothetical protein